MIIEDRTKKCPTHLNDPLPSYFGLEAQWFNSFHCPNLPLEVTTIT